MTAHLLYTRCIGLERQLLQNAVLIGATVYKVSIKSSKSMYGEMPQKLRALRSFLEDLDDLGLFPNTPMTVHNCL